MPCSGASRPRSRPTSWTGCATSRSSPGAGCSFGYFQTVHAALMVGRRERGRTRLRVAGAIGHAINFHTWHSLVREQQLSVDEAITLMTATVQAAAQPAPVHPAKPEAQPLAHAHK